MNSDKNIVEYDMRGQICPSCLLMALQQINELQDNLRSGQNILHIMTDDRQSTSTIPNAVSNMGYKVNIEKVQDYYSIIISSPNSQPK